MLRRASHRGYWYSSDPTKLSSSLDGWLAAAAAEDNGHFGGGARALIVPHAGYEYSGACSAHAYRQIDARRVRRVFILGPSHYAPHKGCCLPAASAYEAPDGNAMPVDAAVVGALRRTQQFGALDVRADEEEHSIEMQLPYLAKVTRGGVSVVPVIVGAVTPQTECVYGEIFASYLRDPANLFVVSSDFCHWGGKFNYTLGEENAPRIGAYIERLDRDAMEAIATLNPSVFRDYLSRTRNTICGRNAISILLNAITQAGYHPRNATMRFLNYKQSSPVHSPSGSCVCYAAAAFVVHDDQMDTTTLASTTNGIH